MQDMIGNAALLLCAILAAAIGIAATVVVLLVISDRALFVAQSIQNQLTALGWL